MVHLALLDGVAQRPDHMLLTDDVGKRARAVTTVERGANGHGQPSLVGRSVVPRPAQARAVPPAKKADRAPSVEAGTRGAATVSRLLLGAPMAPEGGRLRLLPSGPDLVHGSSSSRDRTIDIAHRAQTPGPVPLGRGFSPARADCGYRAPLAPRLARSKKDRTAPGAKNEAVMSVVLSDGGRRTRGLPRRRYLADAAKRPLRRLDQT